MILLKKILMESQTKEEAIIDYIRNLIDNTKFYGKAFIAGGYVRDMVMGKKSKDIDITVSLPNGGIEFADFITKKSGVFKKGSNPVIFPNFGTAKFTLPGIEFNGMDLSGLDIECVMTRKEQYTFGDRKPTVDFGTPEEDVERRDLTINSLLYDISNKKILDLTGKGLSDIKNKIIRTPLDANIIFKEDPLRMLRVVRFACRYDWTLSNEMIKSLRDNYRMLEYISEERKREELNKILLSKYPDVGIQLLMDTNLMKFVIPELYGLAGLKQNKYHYWDALGHTLQALKNSSPRLEVRIAALLHDIGKYKTKSDEDGEIHFYKHDELSANMSKDILKRLKYPNNFIDKVYVLINNHMRTKSLGNDLATVPDKVLRKLVRDLSDDLEDLLDVIHADNISHGPIGWTYNLEKQVDVIRERIKNLGNFTAKTKLPINGNMIMKILNIKPGEQIGKLLKMLEDYFLEYPDKISTMSDSDIESLVKTMYNELIDGEK